MLQNLQGRRLINSSPENGKELFVFPVFSLPPKSHKPIPSQWWRSISIGGVRGSIWIGRGIKPPALPDSKLSRVYAALQAWKSAITDDPNKILDTWVGSDVCGNTGVFCVDPQDGLGDPTGPTIAGIDLNHANLQGVLVKELSLIRHVSSSPKQQQVHRRNTWHFQGSPFSNWIGP